MVEISKSGSGEGLGGVIPRGYSKTREQREPRLRGRSVLVRYADDVVIVLEQESDAHRVWDVLPKRLARFGLTMHPAKSRLVPFRRPRFGWRPGQDGDRFPPPGTFDVLGFTHYWGPRTGSWVLKRKTAKDRLRRTLTAINRLFVDLSTRIRGSWSSCNPMKIGVFLSFARSISRFCGGRLRGPRSWMGGLLGGVHA